MYKVLLVLVVLVLLGAGCTTQPPQKPAKVKERVVLQVDDQPRQQPSSEGELLNNKVMYNKAILKTNFGDIVIEFYTKDAPRTVKNFQDLASSGFYDRIKFHRVIKNFMIQAGDPLSKDDAKKDLWGTGGPGYKFADEINEHKLVRGSLAMANAGPNTNGSQFFIVTATSTPWLDGKHTNFGYVVEGMEVVDKIAQIETDGNDRPLQSVIIEGVELE